MPPTVLQLNSETDLKLLDCKVELVNQLDPFGSMKNDEWEIGNWIDPPYASNFGE
jgi:hypothetical protein